MSAEPCICRQRIVGGMRPACRAAVHVPSSPWPLEFFAPGAPAPQGSKNQDRHGRMYESAKGLGDWRKAVWAYARQAMRTWQPIPAGVPVYAELQFVMPRIKALPKTKATPPHTKKPDADKLSRAVFDAMTGVVYADDSQVTRYLADKRYAEPGERTGVHVLVRPRDHVTTQPARSSTR